MVVLSFILIGNLSLFAQEAPEKKSEQKEEKKEEKVEKKGFGISISPSVIRMMGKPGQSQNATIRVMNNGPSPTQVMVEASDVGNSVDEKGKLARQFIPAGTLPFSCAKWVLLRESDFKLQPNEFRDTTFVLSPPADTMGGFSCVVFFRGIPFVENPKGGDEVQTQTTVQIQPRLGAMVFYEIQGTVKRSAELLDLKSEPPSATTPLKIRYNFKNTGNTDVLISGTFYILDANKALTAKGDLKTMRMFPGEKGADETEWTSSLAPGKYQLVVTFELGPDAREVIVKELEFSVS